jgi:hypothetical protein
MDQGWIVTLAAPTKMAPQISIASEGGSETAVPDLSVEVDDLDEALRRVRAFGAAVEYGPTSEPWLALRATSLLSRNRVALSTKRTLTSGAASVGAVEDNPSRH